MHTTHRDTLETTPENLIDFIAVNPHGTPGIEELIIERFNITAVRFTVLLNRAITSPRGLAHDPITCRHLRERAANNTRNKARILA